MKEVFLCVDATDLSEHDVNILKNNHGCSNDGYYLLIKLDVPNKFININLTKLA